MVQLLHLYKLKELKYMENLKPTNIIDIVPDQIAFKTWDELFVPDPQLVNYGTGVSPIAKYLQSPNFRSGLTGWQIDSNGNTEFNAGIFRGRFEVGGTTITITTTDDIQENLDLIESEGGGTLYLQNGTYTLTADILIPSGVTLRGISRDGVIINCNTSYAKKSQGQMSIP